MIIGIDPGHARCGVVALADDNSIVFHSIFTPVELMGYLRDFAPNSKAVFAVERLHPYSSRLGFETFQTVELYGAICEALRGMKVIPAYRREVKQHWLGRVTGNDKEIKAALQERVGPIGTKKEPGALFGLKGDEFQALAIALAVSDQLGGELNLARKPMESLLRLAG